MSAKQSSFGKMKLMMCLILCSSLLLQGCIEKSFILTLIKCLPDTAVGKERFIRMQVFVDTFILVGALNLLAGSFYREERLQRVGDQGTIPGGFIPGQSISKIKIRPLSVQPLRKAKVASFDKLRFIVRLRTASNVILSSLAFESNINADGTLPPQKVLIPAFVVKNKQKIELAVAPLGGDLKFGTLKLKLKYVGQQP